MSGYEEVITTTDDGKFRVVTAYDDRCESPLDSGDWWAASVLYYDYPRGIVALYDPEGRLAAAEHFAQRTNDPDAWFTRYMAIFHGITVEPVTVGSGVSRGLAWVEPSELKRIGFDDKIAPASDANPHGIIEAGIAEYNAWANGECYGFMVQERAVWQRMDDTDGEHDARETWEDTNESCWGFIGRENVEDEARSALKAYAEQHPVTA